MRKAIRFVFIMVFFVALFSRILVSQTGLADIERQLEGKGSKDRLDILTKVVETYWESEPQKISEYGQMALDMLKIRGSENFKLELKLSNYMGAMCILLGKYRDAEHFLDRSFFIARMTGDQSGEADTFIIRGDVYRYTGDFSKAVEYYEKALFFYNKNTDKKGISRYYYGISAINWKLGNFPSAIEKAFLFNRICEELGDKREIANSLNLIGVIYLGMGEYSKALEHFFPAEAMYLEQGDRRGLGKVYNNIGRAYLKQGAYTKSLEYFNLSVRLDIEIGLQYNLGYTYSNIGETYAEMNNHLLALDYFSKSIRLKEKIDDKQGIVNTSILIGKTYMELGKYTESLSYLNRAYSTAAAIKIKTDMLSAALALSQVYERIKNYRMALEYFRRFQQVNDEIFSEHNNEKILYLKNNYEKDKKEKELALLQKNSHIRQIELDRYRKIRIFAITISILVLLLGVLIHTRMRLKARINRQLEKEIEEHKKTSIKLRKSEEIFKSLAEKHVVGICIIQDNEFKYCNPRFAEIFGYRLDEIYNFTPISLVTEMEIPRMKERIKRLIRNNGKSDSTIFSFQGIKQGGAIMYLDSYGTRISYRGYPALLETVIDSTIRKQVEMDLVNSQRMESIGILAGGIAHDFNNMLTVIIGNLCMASEETDENTATSKMLEDSLRAAFLCADLAQKLVTFSKGGWISPEPLDFSSILKEALEIYPKVKPYVRVIGYQQDLLPLLADERQIRQVIVNLLQNACEASIDCENKLILIEPIGIILNSDNKYGLNPGTYVRISIKDNGRGIPKENIKKVFEPYFTTKDGTGEKTVGMGLAICHSIITKHNGHISLNSIEGNGTTVNIILPAYSLL